MQRPLTLFLSTLLAAGLSSCGGEESHDHDGNHAHEHSGEEEPSEDHGDESSGEHDHDQEEVPLPDTKVGKWTVKLAQGHGSISAGEEGHLVVVLPFNDGGATTVRAWIGTQDRTLSFVGKGEYAPSHDDYDVHATAPDPLPADASWWIEIVQPDGTKAIGSAEPIR